MANIKISQLTSLSTMTDAAIIPVVAAGVTQQISGANLKNYFTGSAIANGTSNINIATANGNVTVASAGNTWTFGTTGTLTLPGANADYTIATQSGYITVGNLLIGQGGSLFNSNNDSWALYGNISDPGTSISIPSNASAGNGTPLVLENQISNVEIRSGFGTWTFDSTGAFSAPGNITAGNLDAVNLVINRISSDDSSFVTVEDGVNVTGEIAATGNITGGNLLTSGVVSFAGGSRLSPLGANLDIFAGAGAYVNLTTSDESSRMGVDNGGGYIVTAGGTWGFGTTGNLSAPGNISAVGNVTAGNISTGSGSITGGNVNGNVFNGNVAFGNGVIGGAGNISGGNISAIGNITGGNISASGNISAGNIGVSERVTCQSVVTDPVNLGSLTAVFGARGFILDGNLAAASNFGAQVSGSGSNTVPVWSDGTNWYIG
jgi:hypothetical protein